MESESSDEERTSDSEPSGTSSNSTDDSTHDNEVVPKGFATKPKSKRVEDLSEVEIRQPKR